jgi:hypothetical protein
MPARTSKQVVTAVQGAARETSQRHRASRNAEPELNSDAIRDGSELTRLQRERDRDDASHGIEHVSRTLGHLTDRPIVVSVVVSCRLALDLLAGRRRVRAPGLADDRLARPVAEAMNRNFVFVDEKESTRTAVETMLQCRVVAHMRPRRP